MQWRVQEFVWGGGGGRKSESLFFCFSIFQGGPSSENSRENNISTKKVAKYRLNSLKFALMTLFCFSYFYALDTRLKCVTSHVTFALPL